jgi:hypothetical protein
MRFTELERSLLATNAALVARLDLIEQGDDLADAIADARPCVDCQRKLQDLAANAHARETQLIDDVEDVRKQRDAMFALLTALDWATSIPADVHNSPDWIVYKQVEEEWKKDTHERYSSLVQQVAGTQQKAEPAEPKPLQLEVGKSYRRRDGFVVAILRDFGTKPYRFGSMAGSYTADGYWHSTTRTQYDLIEEVTEAEAAEVAA